MPDLHKVNNQDRNQRRMYLSLVTVINLTLMIALFIMSFIDSPVAVSISKFFLVLLLLVFCLQSYALFKFFRSISTVEESANLLSHGDLNISDILADETQGVESLTVAFNDMKRNLLNFIDSTKGNVIVLSEAIDTMTKSLDMSYKGNEHIATSMNTVAERAQQQLTIANNTLEQIEIVSKGMENISSSLANIENFVASTARSTGEGSSHVDRYNNQINVISTNLHDTAEYINTLNNYINQIDQVSGLIMNITEQLKLLSLNSAVEAARAGEAGKGFVVVAQEMSKLSSATRNSIGEINRLLTNINSSNEQVSVSIETCIQSFDISRDIFKSVQDSFDNINKNTNILSEDMRKVFKESQAITNITKGMNQQGLLLHKSSEDISSITQDVAAVTEEELAENEEIKNQALVLQNLLASIERFLKRYKTSVVPVNQVSPKKLKLVMITPLDHPFWHGVRQGAMYAKNELKPKNVEVEYIGHKKMDHRFNQSLIQKIDEGCDGVVIPGFMSDIDDELNKAYARNIPVITFNTDFPGGINRLAYFGPDVKEAATIAGELIIKALNEQGEFAIVRGNYDGINKIRQDAILDVTSKRRNLKFVDEIQTEVGDEPVYHSVKDTLRKNPGLKIIVVITGGIQGAVDAIIEMGHVGKTKLICFDYDDQVLENIKRGVIYAAIGQDPFGQGHSPLISLYNYIVAGIRPDDISYTRTEVIDVRSVDM